MTKTDKALLTAREILDEASVCECGHTASEHLNLEDDTSCRARLGTRCRCKAFRPVRFTVERTS